MATLQQQPNKLEHAVREAAAWIRTHQERFWSITGTVIATAVIIGFMINRRTQLNDQAWTQLGAAQGLLMQNQYEQANKALSEWSNRYKGSSANTYADFMRADLLYGTSNYAGAADVYGQLATTGRPDEVRPLAMSAQAAAQEMAGQLPQAEATAKQFIDKYPDHFLTASMYLTQARLAEMSGNAPGASAIYDRFVILYPQSPWTAFVRFRLQRLSPSPSSPLPIKK